MITWYHVLLAIASIYRWLIMNDARARIFVHQRWSYDHDLRRSNSIELHRWYHDVVGMIIPLISSNYKLSLRQITVNSICLIYFLKDRSSGYWYPKSQIVDESIHNPVKAGMQKNWLLREGPTIRSATHTMRCYSIETRKFPNFGWCQPSSRPRVRDRRNNEEKRARCRSGYFCGLLPNRDSRGRSRPHHHR